MLESGKSRFLVTTPGVSATRWVSFALAARPDVYVTHGKFALDSVTGSTLAAEQRDGDHGSLTRGNALKEFYAERTLAEVFDAYRAFAPAAIAHGNVHTFTVHELLQREAAGQALDGVRIANLTRHPVNFVESHAALVRSSAGQPDLWNHYRNELAAVVAHCPESLLVPCTDPIEGLAFAVSCLGVRRAALDLAVRRWPNVRMEDVTTDREALRRFCEELTGLEYSAEALDLVLQAGPINSHRQRAPVRDPAETWRRWPAWRRDLFQLFVDREVLDLWAEAGYDVRTLLETSIPRTADTSPATTLGDFAAQFGYQPERPSAELVEGGFLGFNLLRAGDEFIALAMHLGEADWRTVTRATIARWESEGTCLTAGNPDHLKEVLRTRPPESLGERDGFNLLAFRGRFVALAQSLGEIDLNRQTEPQLRQLEAGGELVTGPSLKDVEARLRPPEFTPDCSAIVEELLDPQAEIVARGTCGDYTLFDVNGWHHALDASLAATDLRACSAETLGQWRERFRWAFHPNEAALREWCLDGACSREADFPGLRVVRHRGRLVALSEALGDVEIARIPDFLLQRWTRANQCFIARNREELWNAVVAAFPAQAEGCLYGWSLWRFLNRSLALAEGVSLPHDEAELQELMERELCLTARSPEILRDAIFARVPPRLVDSGFQGFNLVEHRLEFFALSEGLGPVDLTAVSDQQAAEWHALGQFFRAPAIEELWMDVLLHEPRLIKELPGFNVVNCQGRIVALSQALGSVSLQHVDPEMQARWAAQGLWIEAARLEEIDAAVEAQHRRWLATDRHGWDVFAFRGRIWAVVHGALGGPVELVTDERLDELAREGKCLWSASETALEVMCLQRRADDLARRLQEMQAAHQQMQAAHQQLQQRWVMRVGRGAKRLARVPRRLAAAGWRRVARRLFSL